MRSCTLNSLILSIVCLLPEATVLKHITVKLFGNSSQMKVKYRQIIIREEDLKDMLYQTGVLKINNESGKTKYVQLAELFLYRLLSSSPYGINRC